MVNIEVHVRGQIDESWSEWMDGMAVLHTERGDTVLTGCVRDQAVLHGILDRLFSLGLPLVSVSSEGPCPRHGGFKT